MNVFVLLFLAASLGLVAFIGIQFWPFIFGRARGSLAEIVGYIKSALTTVEAPFAQMAVVGGPETTKATGAGANRKIKEVMSSCLKFITATQDPKGNPCKYTGARKFKEVSGGKRPMFAFSALPSMIMPGSDHITAGAMTA